MSDEKRYANYLTVAQNFALESALHTLNDAGLTCFMVGSCLERANFRDVDIRCVVFDGDQAGPLVHQGRVLRRLMDAAMSEWLSARTGLPIDFQFQSFAENAKHQGKPRNGAGILIFCEREQDCEDAALESRSKQAKDA